MLNHSRTLFQPYQSADDSSPDPTSAIHAMGSHTRMVDTLRTKVKVEAERLCMAHVFDSDVYKTPDFLNTTVTTSYHADIQLELYKLWERKITANLLGLEKQYMNLDRQESSRLLQISHTLSARLRHVYKKIKGPEYADQSVREGTGSGSKAAQGTTEHRENRKISVHSPSSAPNSGFGATTTVIPFKRVEPELPGTQKARPSNGVVKTATTTDAEVALPKTKRREFEASVAAQSRVQTTISLPSQGTSQTHKLPSILFTPSLAIRPFPNLNVLVASSSRDPSKSSSVPFDPNKPQQLGPKPNARQISADQS
jgi:hypothetical protein